MLQITDLVVNYDRMAALKNINITIGDEGIVALIGNNGAGKTTILKSISGLLKPKSGDIIFNGKSIINIPPYKIVEEGIIHVPEGRKIFPNLTVMENLLLGAHNLKDKNRIDELTKKVFYFFPKLESRVNQYGGTLSGGEQQMLAIGRSIMADPKLLLLDEPSLGLAPQIVEKIAEIIVEISSLGVPILLVEQNANIALEISDKSYLLETGQVVVEGKSCDLLNNDIVKKTYLGIA